MVKKKRKILRADNNVKRSKFVTTKVDNKNFINICNWMECSFRVDNIVSCFDEKEEVDDDDDLWKVYIWSFTGNRFLK